MGNYETTALDDGTWRCDIRIIDGDDIISLITTGHTGLTVETQWTVEDVLSLICDLSGAVHHAIANRAAVA